MTVISLFVFCGIIGAFIQAGHRAAGQNVRRTKIDFTEPVSNRHQPDPPAFIKGDGRSSGWPSARDGLAWIKMLLALALLAVGSA